MDPCSQTAQNTPSTSELLHHQPADFKMSTGRVYNFVVIFFVTFGSLTYGYNSAIIGAVIGLPSFFEYFDIDIKSAGGSRVTGGKSLAQSCCLPGWLIL